MKNKKKKSMNLDNHDDHQSDGKIHLTKEMPQIEKDLPSNVPQARLIRQKNNIMEFEAEYTPDSGSYWHGGKYLFSFHFPDDYPSYTGLSCIAGVYQLFVEPNPNDPLNHEVAKLMRDNISQFKENVKRTLRGGYQFGQQFPKFTKY